MLSGNGNSGFGRGHCVILRSRQSSGSHAMFYCRAIIGIN